MDQRLNDENFQRGNTVVNTYMTNVVCILCRRYFWLVLVVMELIIINVDSAVGFCGVKLNWIKHIPLLGPICNCIALFVLVDQLIKRNSLLGGSG